MNKEAVDLWRVGMKNIYNWRYTMMFHVTLEKAEDSWIVAECPALPGCISQGKDEEEALSNIREAITGWLWAEDLKAMKNYTQNSTSFQPVMVSV